jgi:hypothetical protein
MIKVINILFFLFLSSCSYKMMNQTSFSTITIGSTEKELFALAGKPYASCRKKDGSMEYEYIEKFDGPRRKQMQITYYITVKKGKVIHKRWEKTFPPGYMYDSLDYQSKAY